MTNLPKVGLFVFLVAGIISLVLPSGSWLFGVSTGVGVLGLVMAALLLAVQAARDGDDLVAVGFIFVALGQVVALGAISIQVVEQVETESLGAGVATYGFLLALGLLLIAASRRFTAWVRIVGLLAGLAFAAVVVLLLTGTLVITSGNPYVAVYIIASLLLMITVIGWWSSVSDTDAGQEDQAPLESYESR